MLTVENIYSLYLKSDGLCFSKTIIIEIIDSYSVKIDGLIKSYQLRIQLLAVWYHYPFPIAWVCSYVCKEAVINRLELFNFYCRLGSVLLSRVWQLWTFEGTWRRTDAFSQDSTSARFCWKCVNSWSKDFSYSFAMVKYRRLIRLISLHISHASLVLTYARFKSIGSSPLKVYWNLEVA